jgi:hypothetical protein
MRRMKMMVFREYAYLTVNFETVYKYVSDSAKMNLCLKSFLPYHCHEIVIEELFVFLKIRSIIEKYAGKKHHNYENHCAV